jgi:anti-sigma regulatory factor (Ser/Thr protein kinase)
MSGYSRGELLGMRIIDLEADETPDELRKRIRRIIRAGCIVYANPKAEEVLGLKRSALRNRTYDQKEWKITGVNGGAYPREELPFNMVQARSKPVYDVRHAIEWPDTSRRILSIDAAPLQDDRGDFDGMIATLIDITRQGQVFRITIREYILDLLNGIFSTLSRQKVELESDIEDLQVPPRVVIPLGLIINETATNAIKHGFAEEEPAHFYVSLNSKASNGAVVLELWNSGREFPADIDPLQAESQGLLLITSLADHLRGTLQLTRTPSPRFTLRFPLEPFKEESANNG